MLKGRDIKNTIGHIIRTNLNGTMNGIITKVVKVYIVTQVKKGKIKARKIIIDHYSNGKNCCACCNEKIYEFLTFDHLNREGTKHRKTIARYNICIWLIQNNLPEGFQILCYNCNAAKQFNHGCPHKQQMIHVIPPDSRCVIEQ